MDTGAVLTHSVLSDPGDTALVGSCPHAGSKCTQGAFTYYPQRKSWMWPEGLLVRGVSLILAPSGNPPLSYLHNGPCSLWPGAPIHGHDISGAFVVRGTWAKMGRTHKRLAFKGRAGSWSWL